MFRHHRSDRSGQTLDKIAAAGVAGGGQGRQAPDPSADQVGAAGLTGDELSAAVPPVRTQDQEDLDRTDRAVPVSPARADEQHGYRLRWSVLSVLPLGIVFGHISLSQIKRNGEEGRGLAIAGLVISYVITVMTIVAVVVSAVLMVWMGRMLEEGVRSGSFGVNGRTAMPPTELELPRSSHRPISAPTAPTPATPTPPANRRLTACSGKVPTTPRRCRCDRRHRPTTARSA